MTGIDGRARLQRRFALLRPDHSAAWNARIDPLRVKWKRRCIGRDSYSLSWSRMPRSQSRRILPRAETFPALAGTRINVEDSTATWNG